MVAGEFDRVPGMDRDGYLPLIARERMAQSFADSSTPEGAALRGTIGEEVEAVAPGVLASDPTITAAVVEKVGDPLRLEKFGAGVSSDDDALDAAIAAGENRVIQLDSGRVYRIMRPHVIDLTKVRGFQGNHARFEVVGDITALRVIGTHGGSANPNSSPVNLRDTQFVPSITDLHIAGSAPDGEQLGVGIEVKGTFGVQIRGCYIRDLRVGIKVTGNNRNIKFLSNEIWNLRDYGVWFDSTSITHQVTITGNGVSYARKCLYFDGATLYNTQIVSNDLELSSVPTVTENVLHFRDGLVEDLGIVGNTIEDHSASTGPLIAFTSTGATAQRTLIRVCDNNIANFNTGAIYTDDFYNLVISGNTARGSGGYFFKARVLGNGQSKLLNVVGNVCHDLEEGGLVSIASETGNYYAEHVKIADNQAFGLGAVPISVTNTSLTNSDISDNALDISSNPSAQYPNLGTHGMVELIGGSYHRNVHIKSNRLRGRNKISNAVLIQGTPSGNKVSINVSDNLAREVTDATTPFSVGTVGLARDNIYTA